jgi:hypothetical protein
MEFHLNAAGPGVDCSARGYVPANGLLESELFRLARQIAMRSLSIVGVWVFEFLANHRLLGSKVEEEHDRPMARRPQGDEAGVAFPKTA